VHMSDPSFLAAEPRRPEPACGTSDMIGGMVSNRMGLVGGCFVENDLGGFLSVL
jgi:hypothetical protein